MHPFQQSVSRAASSLSASRNRMPDILFCAVRLRACELSRCHMTFGDNTLKMRTGKIHFAIGVASAKVATSVSAYFLFSRDPADLRDEQRSAGRSRQPAYILPVFSVFNANSGPLEGLRRPACT